MHINVQMKAKNMGSAVEETTAGLSLASEAARRPTQTFPTSPRIGLRIARGAHRFTTATDGGHLSHSWSFSGGMEVP